MRLASFLAIAFTTTSLFAQANVAVTADSPLLRSNADLLRRVTVQAVQKYAPGNPFHVWIAIVPGDDMTMRDASSTDGYWAIEASSIVSSSHEVPLVGGRWPDVGFLPTVSASGGTIGYAPGRYAAGPVVFSRGVTAALAVRYVIADANGHAIETRTMPLAASRFTVGGALESYRTTATYIAKRLANLQ